MGKKKKNVAITPVGEAIDVDAVVPLKTNQDEQKDRLTLMLQVRHEHCCVDPVGFDYLSVSSLETMEDTYRRRVKTGSIWKPLDIGFLCPEEPGEEPKAGLLILRNLAGTGLGSTRTKEEEDELRQQVILLRHKDSPPCHAWTIKPGLFFIGETPIAEDLVVAAQKGTPELSIVVIPR